MRVKPVYLPGWPRVLMAPGRGRLVRNSRASPLPGVLSWARLLPVMQEGAAGLSLGWLSHSWGSFRIAGRGRAVRTVGQTICLTDSRVLSSWQGPARAWCHQLESMRRHVLGVAPCRARAFARLPVSPLSSFAGKKEGRACDFLGVFTLQGVLVPLSFACHLPVICSALRPQGTLMPAKRSLQGAGFLGKESNQIATLCPRELVTNCHRLACSPYMCGLTRAWGSSGPSAPCC